MTAIIDYNTGNLFSLIASLERVGVDYKLTSDSEEILSSDSVILPGVGEASNAMSELRKRGLDKVIPLIKAPVLGICIGMQLMCSSSEEGDAECLNIFPNKVIKLRGKGIKIPHMGWNSVANTRSPLFTGIEERAYFYFVHSFAPVCNEFTAATTEYGDIFSSALSKNNFYGTQFHPEKSGETGEILLRNFIKIKD
ncbi:Imidazole glycerol phosphate synthase subunit hisH [Bacteroidales bacterium CF]|jgi:glutamine amidotransferase|nr:Imidazole glycerol phosphate synthase subunit hisH [Bacteroidales bacterium CF]NCB97588.1 imidazole glycerol phosphate synthase subunit HisH [Bacteroidia bacterium]